MALIAPVVAIAAGLAVVLAMLPGPSVPWATSQPSSPATPLPPVAQVGYLVDLATLQERVNLAGRGVEPYRSALDDLLGWASEAVRDQPRPEEPIRIDGTEGPFVDDARRAYGLGLAYAVSGEERFAEAARANIRAWVDTATSTANTCPDGGECQTSLIIGRAGPGFVMGASLLEGSKAWTADDREDLRAWMREVVMPAASRRLNNWGDAGTFLRVVAADYIGDTAEFHAALDHWRALIDLIEADGRIPEEVRRGRSGIQYTQEALQYKVAVAEIASRRGIDLWSYEGRAGGSLRAALDRLASYWFRPDAWPDHPDPEVPSTGPVWEIAYAQYRDPRWEPIIEDRRPYGDYGHSAILWTTLTNGVPFGPASSAGPVASPSGVLPSATPTASPTVTAAASSPATTGIDRLSARLRDPWGEELPVRIAWETVMADGDVIVERAVDGGAWDVVRPTAESKLDDTLPIDTPVDYRIGVAADPVEAWARLDDLRIRRVEASSKTTDLEGSWSRASSVAYSAGSALTTDQRDAAIVWRGKAGSLFVVGPVGPTRGRMVIDVDGRRAEVVELYAPSFDPRSILFAVQWTDDEEHEVRIEARHRGGRTTVAVDDLVILSGSVSVGPAS